MAEEACFAHYYPGLDPDEETIVRFDALLAYIPTLIRMNLGKGESMEDVAERATRKIDILDRFEGL